MGRRGGAMNLPPPDRWLDTKGVAAFLAVHYKTVVRLRADGLPCHRLLGRLRYDPGEVARWLRQRGD